jgi:alkaline phosphatase D
MSMVEIDGIKIYDLTVSPLTSGTHYPGNEVNENRIKGSLINEHNYGLLNISGPFRNRELLIQIKSNTGEELWNYTIRQKDF